MKKFLRINKIINCKLHELIKFFTVLAFLIIMFDLTGGSVKRPDILCDSFEKGVPKHWKLTGRGRIYTSDYQAKLGKYSLCWEWKSGDIMSISNNIGNVFRSAGGIKGTGRAAFGIWIYNEKPIKHFLQFEFRKDRNTKAKFNFPLNFKRWQCGFVQYRSGKTLFNKKISRGINNILIKAPLSGKGKLLFDLVIYNGGLDKRVNFVPRRIPWKAPGISEKLTKTYKFTDNEFKAFKKVKSLLLPPKKIAEGNGKKIRKLISELKSWNIEVLPGGATSGRAIQIPSVIGLGKYNYTFYTENGIKNSTLRSYRNDVNRCLSNINRVFANGISNEQEKELVKYLVPFLRHIVNQGFNTSYGIPMNFVYYKNTLTRTVFYVKEYLDEKLRTELSQFLQYSSSSIFGSDWKKPNMDYFYSCANFFILVEIAIAKKENKLTAYKFLSERFSREICFQEHYDGFMPDGSMYHHKMHYIAYGCQGMLFLSRMAYALAGSSLAISEKAFKILKKAALKYYFVSVSNTVPLALQGRHPYKSAPSKYLPEILKNLALSENGGFDSELAQAYINVCPSDKGFTKKYSLKPQMQINANTAMPYAGLVAHRRKHWLALAFAYGKYYSGAEIYAGKNRFGRYIPNGSLDIIGRGGFFESGNKENGWDWRRINGTTAIFSPINKMRPLRKATARIMTPYGFYGGISWKGINGCFAMKVSGNPYDKTFKGLKTYFMVGNRIYALGSNIVCADGQNHVQTTLYQKSLSEDSPPISVDDREINIFPLETTALDTAKAHWLIDNCGNGYYVPAGQKLFYSCKNQTSRDNKDKRDTEGKYATAWLDHGCKPEKGGYEYVVFPYCDKTKFSVFSTVDYQVLERDKKAHIVFDKLTGIIGAVFFKKQKVSKLSFLKGVDGPCMLMCRKTKDKLEIAIGNPDVNREKINGNTWGKSRAKKLKVVFAGNFKLRQAVNGVKIISADRGKTLIEFNCIDGKTFNFILDMQ